MAYLSSPYGKTDSPSIKLSSRDAVDGINKESSPCPYYKRINRYGSAFLKHIAKKQLCYKSWCALVDTNIQFVMGWWLMYKN